MRRLRGVLIMREELECEESGFRGGKRIVVGRGAKGLSVVERQRQTRLQQVWEEGMEAGLDLLASKMDL
jgi:hypothetical protein